MGLGLERTRSSEVWTWVLNWVSPDLHTLDWHLLSFFKTWVFRVLGWTIGWISQRIPNPSHLPVCLGGHGLINQTENRRIKRWNRNKTGNGGPCPTLPIRSQQWIDHVCFLWDVPCVIVLSGHRGRPAERRGGNDPNRIVFDCRRLNENDSKGILLREGVRVPV